MLCPSFGQFSGFEKLSCLLSPTNSSHTTERKSIQKWVYSLICHAPVSVWRRHSESYLARAENPFSLLCLTGCRGGEVCWPGYLVTCLYCRKLTFLFPTNVGSCVVCVSTPRFGEPELFRADFGKGELSALYSFTDLVN